MKVMKLAAVIGLIFLHLACGGEGRAHYLSIGTGGTGGLYYPLGGALASRLSSLDPARSYTSEVTGGSVENVKRLQLGQIDLGFAMSTTVYGAYRGDPDFPEPFSELRVIAPLYPNLVHVLVPRGSIVRNIGDYRGRRLSVGAAGSGTEQVSRHLLDAHGLTYDDIRPQFLSFTESAAGIRDASIAGAILSAGYPAAAVMEVTTTGDARLIPVEGTTIRALVEQRPYFFASTIPAGSYRGVERDVPTVAELNWLVARSDLPDDIVRMVLDLLRDERGHLERITENARQIDLSDLHSTPVPLHDAAAAWLVDNQIAGGEAR